MSITIDPNAQDAERNSAEYQNTHFLLMSLGLLDPEQAGPGTYTTTTIEAAVIEESRVEGDNITYGNAIKIDAENLDQLGLGDDIITYHMDQNGNLELTDHSDTNENNAEGFLLNMDDDVRGWRYDPASDEYTVTRMNGNDDPAFMIQPVEVDGMLQGYFVYGVEENGSEMGLYLDASAVDLTNMDDGMKAELFADPQVADQTLTANNTLTQTLQHKM